MSGKLRSFDGISPRLGDGVFIADGAFVIGDVELADGVSVWYGAVLRGDVGSIRIGARSNVQDLACIHMTTGVSNTIIGEDVTVGHGAIIHGGLIGDRALIGMGAVILDNAEIGEACLIAAGTVVPPRVKIPPRSLVRGQPGRVIRAVTDEEARLGVEGARHYLELARQHRD
ncbi:MAG: gamma carbonic anhydrase family protein [Sorangiineae bacterium]|nr:gamma carbonic anhydrase family protein [Polyangiaceae bacterium]MEB2324948.1 gamma carbonic anhydrase family protein [Sorangiineae bacterium]